MAPPRHGAAGSTLVDGWRNSLNATIRAAETSDEQSALSTVRSAQLERTAARQTRLVTAQKQAPAYLFGLLILVSAVAMLLVTAFTVRGMPALLRVPIILTLTLLLSATLLIINDLDHPFRGISNISAQFVADVAANNSTDYENVWATAVDACDETGHPNRTG